MTPVVVATTMHERVIASAIDLAVAQGWSSVTMARIAEQVGVSRQTVYNEVGSKPALAEAMVLSELGRFLASVELAFDAHSSDLGAAVRAAVNDVLHLAATNPLLRAIVAGANGASSELLPPLSTGSGALLGTARAVVVARLSAYAVVVEARRLESFSDTLVRTVLSHVMSPASSSDASMTQTATDLAWLTSHTLLTPPGPV